MRSKRSHTGRSRGELQLSPAQVAAALGVECLSRARLGALVFPEVDTTIEGWRVEPVGEAETAGLLWSNIFGAVTQPRPATVFEQLVGGQAAPSRELAAEIAGAAPGFRAILGRGAYEEPGFAERFLAAIAVAP